MMRRSHINRRAFSVIQFIEPPCEGIDDFVCVPNAWVRHKVTEQKCIVAYPKKEDPFVTRDRVKRREKINDEWSFYMSIVKYKTICFEDAEYWIAMRKKYGPSVEEELKTTDIYGWMNLDDAAQSTSAAVTDATAEPGSSRQEQLIIAQNNQPMESAQKGTTASDSNGTSSSSQEKDENLQESLPIQDLIIPSIDVDTPTFVISDDEEVKPSIEKQQVVSYQAISQSTKQTKPVRQPLTVEAPFIEMTHESVEKRRRLMNIAAQNPSNLMDQIETLSTRSVEEQSSVITQNQSQNSAQLQKMRSGNSRKSTAPLRSVAISSQEINNVPRINPKRSQNVNTVDSRNIVQSFTNVASASQSRLSSLHMRLPPQRQSQPFQEDSQRQPKKPKKRIGSPKPKNNQQTPTLQRVTTKTLSPILTKLINSVRQALSTTHNQYLQNEHQFQGNHSERSLNNENHLNVIDNTYQTDEWMKEDTPSAHHWANSDSDTVSDDEEISDHETSADEAPIERTTNFYGTGITSGRSCADRPIAAQNSTNHQTHSKVVLEQQILDNFADLLTQMGSTLRYTCDMYNTLRSSILDTTQTFKKLLGAVEQFNSTQNSAGNESFSINLKPEY